MLLKMSAAMNKAKEQAEKRKARRAKEEKDEAEAEPESGTAALEAQLRAIEEEANLGARTEDFLEVEQVLFPVEPSEAQAPDLGEDPFVAAAAEAAAALGLSDLPIGSEAPTQGGSGPESMHDAVFKQAVISGYVATRAVQEGTCSGATMNALFDLIARSSDMDVASAAFSTLLTALGDAHPPKLWRDAGIMAAGMAAAGTAPIAVDHVPSARDILGALEANGFDPKQAATAAKVAAKSGEGGTAAAAAAAPENQNNLDPGLRLQTIKLLLHTAAAVCRYCATHPAAAGSALQGDAVGDLLLAVLHMGLDPAALVLQPHLNAAAAALLGAMDEDDWERELPRMAERLSQLGPSPRARLRLICQLDAAPARRRACELQRFAGCLLVEKVIPGKGPKVSAVSTQGGVPDPATVLSAQPWFESPKALVMGASTAAAVAKSKGTYTISDVEVLLRVCNMLLWPSALRAFSEGRGMGTLGGDAWVPAIPSEEFVTAWTAFLGGVYGNIKKLQPEDQAVKAYASRLQMTYTAMMAEGDGPLSPP